MSTSTQKKAVTQYMRDQISALDLEGLREFVRKTKFTPEQRKLILKELGEVERDPQSSPAEVLTATQAIAEIEAKPVEVFAPIAPKPGTIMEEDKKQNRSFFEIPNFF